MPSCSRLCVLHGEKNPERLRTYVRTYVVRETRGAVARAGPAFFRPPLLPIAACRCCPSACRPPREAWCVPATSHRRERASRLVWAHGVELVLFSWAFVVAVVAGTFFVCRFFCWRLSLLSRPSWRPYVCIISSRVRKRSGEGPPCLSAFSEPPTRPRLTRAAMPALA